MSTMWEFEAADPEVGFLTDTITHTCRYNLIDQAEPAIITSTSLQTVTRQTAGKDEQVVAETTVWTCPACGATTSVVEHWPLWMFESGPGGDV